MGAYIYGVRDDPSNHKGATMKCKKFALALSLTAAFCYLGCEDSTSASIDDDQPVPSSESQGTEGGDKISSSESKDNGGQDQVSSSSAKQAGSEAAPASSSQAAPASSSSVGSSTFPGMDSTFTFDSTAFSFDSSAFADMMKCDEEGATQNMMGAAVLVCRNGQWEYDSEATAEANKCDEDGATKTETMEMGGAFSMEMTYICTDGVWEMQMPDFGGMFGDDSTGGFPGGGMNFGDSSFTMPGGGTGGWGARDSSGAFSGGRSDWGQWLNDRDSSSTQPAGE